MADTKHGAGSVAARRAALRDAVLASAERLVAEGGLTRLAIRDVAAEAGCAVGMVYKLFPGHDALALAVNARTLAALGQAVSAAIGDAAPVRDALERMAGAYLDYAATHTPRWDALFAHRMAPGAAVPDWYVALRDELFDQVAAVVARAIPGDAAGFARTLFSAVHGVVALGLGGKVAELPVGALRAELLRLVRVLADGLERRAG